MLVSFSKAAQWSLFRNRGELFWLQMKMFALVMGYGASAAAVVVFAPAAKGFELLHHPDRRGRFRESFVRHREYQALARLFGLAVPVFAASAAMILYLRISFG